jgi:hypothetical protein
MSRTLVENLHHEQPHKPSSMWILTESFSTGTLKSHATKMPVALLILPRPRPPSISIMQLPPPPPITGLFHVIFRQHSSTQSLLSFMDIWSLLQSPLTRSTPSPKSCLPPASAPINFPQGHALLLKFPSAVRAESVMISAHVATWQPGENNDRLKIVAYPCEPSINGESP